MNILNIAIETIGWIIALFVIGSMGVYIAGKALLELLHIYNWALATYLQRKRRNDPIRPPLGGWDMPRTHAVHTIIDNRPVQSIRPRALSERLAERQAWGDREQAEQLIAELDNEAQA